MNGPARLLQTMTWLVVASSVSAVGTLGAGLSGRPDPIVADEVIRAFAGSEWVRVMVLLDAPGGEPEQMAAASIAELVERASKVENKVLVSLRPDDFKLHRRFEVVPGFAGEVSLEGLRRLSVLPEVLRVEADEGGVGSLAEAVPLTHSDQVQALGWTGEGVTVAVLDSGLDTDHPDLAGDLVGEACFCQPDCCPGGGSSAFGPGAAEDDNGHGTNVTGIVTSDGVVSPVGVAPDAKIFAVKVLSAQNTFCCVSDIVGALNWIIVNRPDVDVINMSLGTFQTYVNDCNTSQATLAAAINTLRSRGVLSFCSSGNDGYGTRMTAPACIAGAISVGAVWDADVGPQQLSCSEPTTAADQVTCFTNTSATTDVFAPGALITSDYLNGGTATYVGTSMASPHAAGCAADLLEAAPGLTPAAIEYALELTGVPVVDATNGRAYPRIDCLSALNLMVFAAGRVPETSLRVSRETSGDLSLTWERSCGETDNDYEIYEGELGNFASHQPTFCTTMVETFKTFTPSEGNRYYLVVPRNWYREGSYGLRSDGTERPQGVGACVARLIGACP